MNDIANLRLDPSFFKIYTFSWLTIVLLALGIMARDRKQLASEWNKYIRFLCVPWKLYLFVPALLFVTFAGHFTDDETWDIVTGSGMSILTFVTAPWITGLFYQILRGKRPPEYLVVALAVCLFSCSWFYDSYLFLRDGQYTARWLGNLMLSPIVYLSAGIMWNLEAKDRFFYGLSFLREDWPEPPANRGFIPLIPITVPFIGIAAFMLTAYVKWHF